MQSTSPVRNVGDEGSRPARILVVEDERIVAMGLRKQLQGFGYEVVGLAASADRASELARDVKPDLILMDVNLDGERDGVQAAAEIRKSLCIPIIFLTAYSNKDVLDRAKRTAPYGYILKPYEERELEVVVETALYKHAAELELEQQRRWMAAVLSSIGDGVVTTDEKGCVNYLNPTAERMTGWSKSDAADRTLEEVVNLRSEKSQQQVASPLHEAMQHRRHVPLNNHTLLIGRDNSQYHIDDCASPILDENGNLLGGVMVFRDVGERREMERVRAELAAIVSGSETAIISQTTDGIIKSWNPGAEKLYGYSASEAVGKKMTLFFPPERVDELGTILAQIRQGRMVSSFETVRRRKDGSEVHIMLMVSPIKDADGEIVGAAAIANDITETKVLEKQFRQAQKLEAIGRLAGGVAHDFNNLLTVITGYSQLLRTLHQDPERVQSYAEQIHRAAERAAALTSQLLMYSRQHSQQLQPVEINSLIKDLLKMLGRMIGDDVNLQTRLCSEACRIKADPTQIEQVVMNLSVNARDAMPGGGDLTIATERVELGDSHFGADSEMAAGTYVLLRVTDTGYGMDAKTLEKIFDPFYSTKSIDKGTGLGLAVVWGIVKQCGAEIRVDSKPGRGTTFSIYFPAIVSKESRQRTKPAVEAKGGSETILLIEDEEGVRNLTRYLLKRSGYHVLDAANGEEALKICDDANTNIDLVITDVIMPKMNGREVADRICSNRPDMKVIYISGYTHDEVLRCGVDVNEAHFIQKPFTVADLSHKIRQVLDG